MVLRHGVRRLGAGAGSGPVGSAGRTPAQSTEAGPNLGGRIIIRDGGDGILPGERAQRRAIQSALFTITWADSGGLSAFLIFGHE